MKKNKSSIVGSYFHSLDENKNIKWQGLVIGKINGMPGFYLIQLFEWFNETPNVKKIVSFSDMLEWQFYDSMNQMRDFYKGYINSKKK